MFKIMHKALDSFVFTKPSVHFLQPKSLNVYFKNAINPQYQLINVSKYDSIILGNDLLKDNNETIYRVYLEVFEKDEKVTIELARFESKTEAQDAVVLLKNKLFSIEKTSVKFIYLLVVLAFLTTFSLAVLELVFSKGAPMPQAARMQQMQQMQQAPMTQEQLMQMIQSQQAGLPNVGAPQVDTAQAYQKLQMERERANKEIEEGVKNMPNGVMPQQAPQSPQTMQMPRDPQVQNFLNQLEGKK